MPYSAFTHYDTDYGQFRVCNSPDHKHLRVFGLREESAAHEGNPHTTPKWKEQFKPVS